MMTCDHKLTNHNANQFQPITTVHSQITTCEVKGYVTTVGDKLSVLAGFIANLTSTDSVNIDLCGWYSSNITCLWIITTTHDLLSSFNSKSQIDVAILDFSKAFDTVPHAGLLGKLEHYGIDSKILLWITNFLNNRKQRVVVDGSFSNYADVESGVTQGTVLGPLLFLLHINDLPSCVNSKVRLFADDCLLYREIKNNQDQIDMQRDLDALMDWGSTWGMKFNAKKCNIMRVSQTCCCCCRPTPP